MDDETLWRMRCNEVSDKLEAALRKLDKAKTALDLIRHMGTLDDEHVRVAHEAFEAASRRERNSV